MAASRSYSGITLKIVERIKQVARDDQGVVFDPPDGTQGTATARTPIGDCVMQFAHDSDQSVLVLTLVKKPMLLPSVLLWNGLQAEVEKFKKMP